MVEFGVALGFADAAVDFGLERPIADGVTRRVVVVRSFVWCTTATLLHFGAGARQHVAFVVLLVGGRDCRSWPRVLSRCEVRRRAKGEGRAEKVKSKPLH